MYFGLVNIFVFFKAIRLQAARQVALLPHRFLRRWCQKWLPFLFYSIKCPNFASNMESFTKKLFTYLPCHFSSKISIYNLTITEINSFMDAKLASDWASEISIHNYSRLCLQIAVTSRQRTSAVAVATDVDMVMSLI